MTESELVQPGLSPALTQCCGARSGYKRLRLMWIARMEQDILWATDNSPQKSICELSHTNKDTPTNKRFEVHTWQAVCRCGLNQLYKRDNIQIKCLDTLNNKYPLLCISLPILLYFNVSFSSSLLFCVFLLCFFVVWFFFFFFWCLDCCLYHCEIEVMNAWWTSHPMHLDDLLAGVDVHSDDLFWSMTLLCTPWICDAAMPKHCKPVPLAFAPPTPQPLCYFVLFISLLQMFESLSDCFCLNKVKHSNNNSKIILHLESPDWS